MFKGPLLIQHYRAGKALSDAEMVTLKEIVSVWRGKLCSISWFMRCLNQSIARQANIEDKCTGKFWECRFNSQALKTEEALLSCMAYVDLNPIRVDMAPTPEDSDYTSIQERIRPSFDLQQAIINKTDDGDLLDFKTALKPLLRFESGTSNKIQFGILFPFKDYLQLVDWTGRIMRDDKRGSIETQLPAILDRLNIDTEQWLINTMQFEASHDWVSQTAVDP